MSGVRVAAAVSVDDSQLTETITVLVEAARNGERTAGELKAEVAEAIVSAAGFAPGQVLVVAPRSVPLTANGKVRHDRLRAMLRDGLIDRAAA